MPAKMRDLFSEEEIKDLDDEAFLISKQNVPAPFNITAARMYGTSTMQRLVLGVIARPQQASKGEGWAMKKPDGIDYSMSDFQRMVNAVNGDIKKESFQKVKYTGPEYKPEREQGAVQTDRVFEDQIATILFFCKWHVEEGGKITVRRELNDRFRQGFWIGKHVSKQRWWSCP